MNLKNISPFPLLLLIVIPLSLQGMEIERPVRSPLMRNEARVRGYQTVEETRGDEKEDDNGDQTRGDISAGCFPQETAAVVPSDRTSRDFVAKKVLAMREQVAAKISQFLLEMEEGAEGIEYHQNLEKCIMVLQKTEPLLTHVEELSFANEDEKASEHFNKIEMIDGFFAMADLIKKKSEIISHYQADIVMYGPKKRRNSLVMIASKNAMSCAQHIIDCTFLRSELLGAASEREKYLTDAIDSFACSEELFDEAVARALQKSKKKKGKSSYVHPATAVSLSSIRVVSAAVEYYHAAQEALKADKWIQARTPIDLNESFIERNEELYHVHREIAELFLESVRYADKTNKSESTNSTLLNIQSELAGAFHELACYQQECLALENIEANTVMNFSEDPLDAEEEQVPINVKKEECLQRIKELQQQEQAQLKKQAALSRFACTIM